MLSVVEAWLFILHPSTLPPLAGQAARYDIFKIGLVTDTHKKMTK